MTISLSLFKKRKGERWRMEGWKSMLLVLTVINGFDSISYAVVGPSLIFYVLSVGGTKEQYGLIMSSFSFFSVVGCFFFGVWVDRLGSKFRIPYIICSLTGIVGGLYYFFASILHEYFYNAAAAAAAAAGGGGPISTTTTTTTISFFKVPIGVIFLGRIIGGFSSSYAALGYSYLALAVPFEEQTRANSLYSLSCIIGFTIGSMVNWFLAGIDKEFFCPWLSSSTKSSLHLTPLNSVGLFVAGLNVLILIVVLLFLEDSPTNITKKDKEKSTIVTEQQEHDPEEHKSLLSNSSLAKLDYISKSNITVWKSICSIDIIHPIMTKLVLNINHQFKEAAFPPAANDALGWGVAEVSLVKSIDFAFAALVLLHIATVAKYVSDTILVILGISFSLIGGLGAYFGWTRGAPAWYFAGSILISSCGYSFASGANRTSFSKYIAQRTELDHIKSTLQAVLSTTNNLPGIMTPFLAAKFIIRTPEEVSASRDNRELTPWALVLPLLCALTLVGLFMSWRMEEKQDDVEVSARTKPTIKEDPRGRIMNDITTSEKIKVLKQQQEEMTDLSARV